MLEAEEEEGRVGSLEGQTHHLSVSMRPEVVSALWQYEVIECCVRLHWWLLPESEQEGIELLVLPLMHQGQERLELGEGAAGEGRTA